MWQTTHWSKIISAQEENREALTQLCKNYWPPLYAFLLKRKWNPEEAQDLVQSFFTCFLEKKWIQKANHNKGKFRNFLLILFVRFIRDHKDLSQQKFEASVLLINPKEIGCISAAETPETCFQKVWIQTLLDLVVDRLREECFIEGKIIEYEILWLYFFNSSPLLCNGDIKAPELFIKKIKQLDTGLYQQLSSYAQETLNDPYLETGQILKILLHDVNQIMQRQPMQTFLAQQKKTLLLSQVSLFSSLDIYNLPNLLKQLKNPSNPVIKHTYSLLSTTTKDLLEEKNNGKDIQQAIVLELNQIIQSKSLAPFFSQLEIPQKSYSPVDQLWLGRQLLEHCTQSVFEPSLLRLNRRILEEAYPQCIIKSIYQWASTPSYRQIANHLQISKHKVESSLKNMLIRYRYILREEIRRYTEEEKVEEEIQQLFTFLKRQ